jgi:hypothetical protein
MQAVSHSRARRQAVLDVLLAVFARQCARQGRLQRVQCALPVPDATGASRSFCRQNGSRTVPACAIKDVFGIPGSGNVGVSADVVVATKACCLFFADKRAFASCRRGFTYLVNLERK